MLTSIREHAQSWVAAFIIGLLSLSFALWGIQYYVSNHGARKPIATVNDTNITQADLQRAYRHLRYTWQSTVGKQKILDQKTQEQLHQKALDQLITYAVVADKAKQLNLSIAPSLLDSVIKSLPVFQTHSGEFSPERFAAVLPHLGYTPDRFIATLEHNLLADQLRQGIIRTALAPAHELTTISNIVDQRRAVRYVRLSAAQFAESASVSKQMAQHYYTQNKTLFKSPEKVSINYIKLSAQALAKTMRVTNEELRAFYNDNLDLYTPKKQTKALPFKKVKKAIRRAVVADVVLYAPEGEAEAK